MQILNQQTHRWVQLLTAALSDAPPAQHTGTQTRLNAARGQHRGWIVACLHGLHTLRAAGTITFLDSLPTIQLPAPAVEGRNVANAVWQAYLQFCLGSIEAHDTLVRAVRSLDPTALRAGPNDNPEPWWANELLILHALQSFALLSGDASLKPHIDRCVAFHIAEIQPDHATNEPWAVHAFATHPDGNHTAETLLHAAMVHGGGSLTPVARLILHDSLHALTA